MNRHGNPRIESTTTTPSRFEEDAPAWVGGIEAFLHYHEDEVNDLEERQAIAAYLKELIPSLEMSPPMTWYDLLSYFYGFQTGFRYARTGVISGL